ncbi:hypothetical protein [Draconibacterium mangrovi]|uniref:hypothetical protein n=1 Tax=Draconibacterium mangrovi TaxID=2697469 RepID=UPI0013D59807|nr:hypothetical protein [Draconibacterium mangrovi]
MNNLAASENYTELRNTMSKEMTEKLQKQGDPRIFGNGDVFDNYEYSGVVKDYYNRYREKRFLLIW